MHETGTSILLIEHDMSVVMEISDHVVVLEYGTQDFGWHAETVKNDPKVIAAYLGVEDEEVVESDRSGENRSSMILTRRRTCLSTEALHDAGGTHDGTIAHSDEYGDRVTVSPGASKAAQVEERWPELGSAPGKRPPSRQSHDKSCCQACCPVRCSKPPCQ